MDVSNDKMNEWLTDQRQNMNKTSDVIFYISILEHLTLLWAHQKNKSKEKADYEKAIKYVINKLNNAQEKRKRGCIGRACNIFKNGFSYITGRGGRKRTHRRSRRTRRTRHRR
jgi:hypothetical protein